MEARPRVLEKGWRLLAVAAGIFAFVGVGWMTSGYGPGLDPDSMAYVGAATSLAHGRGLQVPLGKWEKADSTVELTLWPPAFPAAMAVPQKFGMTSIASARLVLALSAFATVALVALIFLGTIPPAAVIAGLVVIVVTPSFVVVHMSVLSEPLFIACLALTLFAMVRQAPALAALGAGLAVMTRYAGASAAVAAAIWFLFFGRGGLKRRIAGAALSSAPAAIAFLLWLIHNSHVKVVQSAMRVRYYPGIGSTLRAGAGTVLSSIAPGANITIALIVAVAALIAAGAAVRSGTKSSNATKKTDSEPSAAAATLLAAYLAVLICSRMFVGGAIEFDARILAPAIFLLEAALIPIFAGALANRGRGIQYLAAIVVVTWVIAAVSADAPRVLDSIQDGNDLAASDWRESETVDWVVRNAGGHPVYTNWPGAIFFDAHRSAYDIPTSLQPDTLALFGRIVAAQGGIFAAFNERNFDYPPTGSIALRAGLVRVYSLSDGVIWAPPKRDAAGN